MKVNESWRQKNSDDSKAGGGKNKKKGRVIESNRKRGNY